MSIWQQATTIAQQTPPERDRYVDFLRAVSILMVIVGHWLIAGFYFSDGDLTSYNVLKVQPGTQWLTWLFQVMPVFFIVGGYANAVSLESAHRKQLPYKTWLITRLERLLKPLIPLVGLWAILSIGLLIYGLDVAHIQQITQTALVPIWFLAIYLLIVVLAPFAYKLWVRYAFSSVVVLVALAICVDACFFYFDIKWITWTNYFWIWLAVHQLGFAWRAGRLEKLYKQLGLSALGWVSLALLVFIGPYPFAMVGSPDPELSNTLPPKITLIALGFGQFGFLLALQNPARKLLMNLKLWAATVLINSMIMTLYLWHITVLIAVVGVSFWLNGLGLEYLPGSSVWWSTRPFWIFGLLIVLLPVTLALAPIEQQPRQSDLPIPPGWRQISGATITCIGIALLAMFGMGHPESIWIDVISVGGVFGGAWVAGVSMPRKPA